MAHPKRKRAVVLALIAFFCGATAVVSVDWKRFGGGFLAFLKPKSDPVMAAAGGGGVPAGGAILTALADTHPTPGPALPLAAPPRHRHTTSVGGGSGGHKSEEDLFKYGDPAAGGMPAGSFVVAQNEAPAGVGAPLADGAAATETAVGGSSGGDEGDGSVTSSAPGPSIGLGGGGGGGVVVTTPAPPPSNGTPPAQPPATSTPSGPPTQSGTSNQDPGNGDGDPTPPVVITPPSPPSSPVPPVSSVPEASNAAMMGLGALFLAVAASRRRKNDPA